MSEDDILEEFGFDADHPLPPQGRGKVKDMVGKKNGMFVCIARHPENRHTGESQWVMKCSGCGAKRTEPGWRIRANVFRCYECEGRPGNPKPSNIIEDWDEQYQMLKMKMAKAIEEEDDDAIPGLASRICRAAKNRTSSH